MLNRRHFAGALLAAPIAVRPAMAWPEDPSKMVASETLAENDALRQVNQHQETRAMSNKHPTYKTVDVDGFEVFYREAGDRSKPTLLLLHGFPTSSHMFRNLIPLLADHFHLVAPDLPGFGRSALPSRDKFKYSFDSIAKMIGRFVEVIGLDRYAIYIFDYGAPTGLRLALAHPDRITAIVSQNGNAYNDGFSPGWEPVQRYWRDPTKANREALRGQLQTEGIREQYVHGVPDVAEVSPDGWTLDVYYTQRPGVDDIMLDLFHDYQTNVVLYPDFQRYFRERKPKLLAVWGQNDPIFIPAGAEAFKRDLPSAEVHLLDTGHFALETHASEIAQRIITFLAA